MSKLTDKVSKASEIQSTFTTKSVVACLRELAEISYKQGNIQDQIVCMSACDIIKRQAEQFKAKDTYIGELLAKWNQALEQIKATDKMLAEYERLNETVSISCNPPDDCNDPVVLKTYMKACYEAVVPVRTDMESEQTCYITDQPCEHWEQDEGHCGECVAVHPDQCPIED